MVDLSFIMDTLKQNHVLVIFLGSFFFGETMIIAAAFLAGQGLWKPETVFSLSLFGTIASDSLWFLLGKGMYSRFGRWEKYKQKNTVLMLKIKNFFGDKPFYLLLFFKFLYGTRILMIMYLSLRKLKYTKFLFFDTVGTVLWLVVMIGIGYFGGKGLLNLIPYVSRFEYFLTAILVLIIGVKLLTLWINKKIVK